jgi:restriction system protein
MHRPRYPTFDSYDHVDADSGEIDFPRAIVTNRCPICGESFVDLVHLVSDTVEHGLSLCVGCGWWHFHHDQKLRHGDQDADDAYDARPLSFARWWEMYHGALDRIDLSDETLPIETLRSRLARYWDQRTDITAQQAENLVASVLREHHGGEIIRLTANAYAADGGIDLIIVSDGGTVRRAVQIKRRLKRNAESVQDVRNFVGALVLAGERHGTFVTTASSFTRAARTLPMSPSLARARLSLELIDGEQLLELLQPAALQCELALPPTMSLDDTWIAMSAPDGHFHEVPARDLLLGDLRRLAPLARALGTPVRWATVYSRPVADFRRDFRPASPEDRGA